MAKRDDIVRFLNELLDVKSIKDSSQNGLQVQGAAVVRRVGLAVDASLEAYRLAASKGCQMVLAHHGLIWNGITSVTGVAYRHVKFLLDHDINLYGCHLPLDMHAEVGNNAQLAKLLGLVDIAPWGMYHEQTISFRGRLPKAMTTQQIASRFQRALGGRPVLLPFGRKLNRTVALCSGGGADMLEEAIGAGVDCYITGEHSHFNHIQAKEGGANVVFLGH